MKISFAFCLILWISVTAEICTSQIISNGGNEEIKTENGTDILVTEPELMEIIVSNHELTFEICTKKCFTDFLVCYEPDSPEQRTNSFFTKCDKTCGFYVTGDKEIAKFNNTVCYMSPKSKIYKAEECDLATMKAGTFEIREKPFSSCNPKIPENGLIELNITMASSDCPVTIKNAHFKRDPSTVLPSNNDPSKSNLSSQDSPSGNSSSNVFGIFGWIFVLLSIYALRH